MAYAWDDIHNAMTRTLAGRWRYYEIDFSNAYCPFGCCRLIETACSYFASSMWSLGVETTALLGLRNRKEEIEAMDGLDWNMVYFLNRDLTGEANEEDPAGMLWLIGGKGEPWAAWKTSAATPTKQDESLDRDGKSQQ
jgi:hypothetical protein